MLLARIGVFFISISGRRLKVDHNYFRLGVLKTKKESGYRIKFLLDAVFTVGSVLKKYGGRPLWGINISSKT